MLIFPEISPIALQIGPVAIRWYALSYIAAFLIGHWWIKRLNRNHPAKNLNEANLESLFIWIVLGVILGGRFGFALFYHLPIYMADPIRMLKVWEGGMSFHGGLIGVTIAMILFCKKYKANPIDLADRLAPAVPIGLFFGRLANFANGELYGKITSYDFPLATVFPTDPTQLPRHPSQLYEAGLEGLVLFIILYFVTRTQIIRGRATGVFLLGYGLARFVVEYVRQPDSYAYIETSNLITLSSGQILTLPMIFAGCIFLYLSCLQQTK